MSTCHIHLISLREGTCPVCDEQQPWTSYHDDPKPLSAWPHITSNAGVDEMLKDIEEARGIKHDQDKPDLSLVPAEFSAEVARGFMYGANKYGRYNYLNGMDWTRIIAAIKRHVDAFQEGEDLDPESGVSHLAHASCGLAMLLVYYKRGLGTDNRHKK